jgi:hypothetical protein
VKINIHTDQYVAPASSPVRRPASSQSGASTPLPDALAESPTGSNVESTLTTLANSRAARVSQLAGLCASGRYVVNSAQVAESLVSNAFSR